MEEKQANRHIGRKIWYGTAIAFSVIVLVISTVGVIGTWIVEQSLVGVTQNLLSATAKTAGSLREAAAKIDQQSGELRQVSSAVSAISLRIGENIEDKGLLLTLLPAEQEQKLNDTVAKIQQTLTSVREFLTAGIGIYRSINRLPFVDLPELSEDQVVEVVQAVSDIQAGVEELKQNVEDFRSGVAQGVGRITEAADRVTQGLDNLSAMLKELDRALAALQDLALRLEEMVPLAFGLIALFLTLFLAIVAYTQVEFIRLEIRRWKALKAPVVLAAGVAAAEIAPVTVEAMPEAIETTPEPTPSAPAASETAPELSQPAPQVGEEESTQDSAPTDL